jgi:hypothetical protein
MARERRIIAQAAVDPPAPIAAAPDPAPEEADAPEELVEQVIETEEDYHRPQRQDTCASAHVPAARHL